MSWDIELRDDVLGELVSVPHFEDGGTYPMGGTTVADLNVTYNYGEHFSFGSLDGRKAADTITELEAAVATLGIDRDSNYWKASRGNAGFACARLLSWALRHPAAIWHVR